MSIGGSEILVLLVLGLIVLGPERLPKVARTVARMYPGDGNSAYDYGYDDDEVRGEEDQISGEQEDDGSDEIDLDTETDDVPDDEQVADENSKETGEAPLTDEKTPD